MNIICRKSCADEENVVKKLCQKAFTGYPWFEVLSDVAIQQRWEKCSGYKNFQCFVSKESGTIVAASWFCEMTDEEIQKTKGDELQKFVVNLLPSVPRIWIDATVVHPDHQNKGIARQLKSVVQEAILMIYPRVLILTRMRDDNVGIIKINESLGFRRTGIKIPTHTPELFHEFWYLYVG